MNKSPPPRTQYTRVIIYMKCFKRLFCLFLTGGAIYCVIELLYRRRTHPSMFAAGGAALLAADGIRRLKVRHKKLIRSSLCTCAFTLIELAFGLFLNRKLKKKIWDYSKLPFNYKGQICLPFTIAWAALSLPAMGICSLF